MTNSPKIYSLSTVGVRQHENVDYHLHSVRTDFTGNNGLGKSIIADLLQLIFVPLRDEWKPGTEGLDKDKRRIESIPLEKDWIQFAYSFLNIEKSKGQFLTIGVFIPNTSRVPVRPFIIQQGEDFETKGSRLKTFKHILKAKDFIADTGHIYDLKALKRHLYDSYKIHLKDFFNKEEVNNYFDLLFKNQILPIDLTKEVNLKSFAKVLQSFSRAKTLDINKSKSLQDFLFEDNDEIKATFETRKDVLNEHIRNFHTSKQEIETLKLKQEKLEHLQLTFNTYDNSKKEYLLKNCHLLFNHFKSDERTFNDNENKLNKAIDEFKGSSEEYDTQIIASYSKMLEQKEICNEVRVRLEEQQAEAGKQNIESLKKELREKQNFIETVARVRPITEEYKTIEQIENAFNDYQLKKEYKRKLDTLSGMNLFKEFEDSLWSKDYSNAYDYYNEKSRTLTNSVRTLKEVLSLYDGNNPDSLFNWAIKNNEVLSREQETIVMHFKEIFTKRISAIQGKRYTLNPKGLLGSFESDGEGIWVNLGDVSEYYPLVSKQIFNSKGKLQQAIENDKENIKGEIAELENESEEIRALNEALNNIGFNKAYFNIYVDREKYQNWQPNSLFTEENINFAITNFQQLFEIDSLNRTASELNAKIDKLIGDSMVIETKLKQNLEDLTELLNDHINEIKKEHTKPIERLNLDLRLIDLDKLIETRSENKKEIKALEKTRLKTKSKRDDQKGIIDECRRNIPILKSNKTHSELQFKEAKRNLEENTDVIFENQLQMGDVTQEIVDNLKTEYETLQTRYNSEYSHVAEMFEESKSINRNPEIYKSDGLPYFNFYSLVSLLCGKIGLEHLTNKLSELNDNLKTLGELQLKILTEVFGMVEKQYDDFYKTILNLNFFFEKNRISDSYKFRVEFSPKKDINIDWIQKMKEKTRVHKHGIDLFTNPEDFPSQDNTPENLIRNIAKQFYSSANPDPSNLLDPKYYFTINVRMEDDDGKQNSGSGGQAYTALALLCIGRLSIVQKQQEKHLGIRFIIIEELSNIDDTNFNIFPQIAKRFGYQLITMTPKPFGSYTDEEWYLHMLVKGKEDKFRNYTPMSFFKTKSKNIELEEYLIKNNDLEGN